MGDLDMEIHEMIVKLYKKPPHKSQLMMLFFCVFLLLLFVVFQHVSWNGVFFLYIYS